MHGTVGKFDIENIFELFTEPFGEGNLAYHGHFPPCAGAPTNRKRALRKQVKRVRHDCFSWDSHLEVEAIF